MFPFVFPRPNISSETVFKCSVYVVHLLTFILTVDHHLYLVKSKSTCPRRVLLLAAQQRNTLQVILNVNDTLELCGKKCSSCIKTHSIRSLLSTSINTTPHERFISFQRRSLCGVTSVMVVCTGSCYAS